MGSACVSVESVLEDMGLARKLLRAMRMQKEHLEQVKRGGEAALTCTYLMPELSDGTSSDSDQSEETSTIEAREKAKPSDEVTKALNHEVGAPEPEMQEVVELPPERSSTDAHNLDETRVVPHDVKLPSASPSDVESIPSTSPQDAMPITEPLLPSTPTRQRRRAILCCILLTALCGVVALVVVLMTVGPLR